MRKVINSGDEFKYISTDGREFELKIEDNVDGEPIIGTLKRVK